MTQSGRIQFLERFCNNGSLSALEKGYDWFNSILLSELKLAEQICKIEKGLLAECWLVIGEIYELNNAPLKALECYEKARLFDPKCADTYRWISAIQEQLGDYIIALRNIELAMNFAPHKEELMWDRQRIQDCMVYDKAPDYSKEDLVWKYCELLANNKFDLIIAEIEKLQTADIEVLRCLSRAVGGKKDRIKYGTIWNQIVEVEPEVEKDRIDLFYRP